MNNQHVDTCRKVLNLGAFATLEEMKKAFRDFQKQNHPDNGGDPSVFIMVQNTCEWLTRKAENPGGKDDYRYKDKAGNVIVMIMYNLLLSFCFDLCNAAYLRVSNFSKINNNEPKRLFASIQVALLTCQIAIISRMPYYQSLSASINFIETIYPKINNTPMRLIKASIIALQVRSLAESITSLSTKITDSTSIKSIGEAAEKVFEILILTSIASSMTNRLYNLFSLLSIEQNVDQETVKNNESTVTENVGSETTNLLDIDNQAKEILEIPTLAPTITLAYDNSKNIENISKYAPTDELTTEEILPTKEVNNTLRFSI